MLHIRIVEWEEEWFARASGIPLFGIMCRANSPRMPSDIDSPTEETLAFFANMNSMIGIILLPGSGADESLIVAVRQGHWFKTGLVIFHELLHFVACYIPGLGDWIHKAIDGRKRREDEQE